MSEINQTEKVGILNETEVDLVKFTCSTPIKMLQNNEFDMSGENENLDKSNLEESLNKSSNLIKNEFINMNGIFNRERKNGNSVNSSLIEFEQNEILAELTISNSYYEFPKLKEPIKQMEHLIMSLRSNYELEKHFLCPKNNENLTESNLKSLANRNLPMSSKHLFNLSKEIDCESNRLSDFEAQLENERIKREHCEKEIYELNEKNLQLQQKLAVSYGIEKKNEIFMLNVDSTLQKIIDDWRLKEIMTESFILQVKKDKQIWAKNESKSKMRTELLENEIKSLGDQLVGEKVKSQEYLNELNNLKKILSTSDKSINEKTQEIKELNEQKDKLHHESQLLKTELENFKNEFSKFKNETSKKEENLLSRIDELTTVNKSLLEKNLKIQNEYEKLINEAKMMVNESEKQYSQLIKTIETERIGKDSLQVEINLLEEKLEQTVKVLSQNHEKKIEALKKESIEKETSIIEFHRKELDEINSKFKIEFERIKAKNFDDLQEKINEYEMKLTDQSLKMDSLLTEIDRLKRANIDLEFDRNTIRQNLKKMLQVQMSEAMQLLGVNSEPAKQNPVNTTKISTINFDDNIEKNSKLNEIKTDSLSCLLEKLKSDSNECETKLDKATSFNLDNFLDAQKIISSSLYTADPCLDNINLKLPYNSINSSISLDKNQTKSMANLNSTINSDVKRNNSSNTEIKDAFIINQIDLINQYYQIDNNALAFAASIDSNSASLSQNLNNSISSIKIDLNSQKEPKIDLKSSKFYDFETSFHQTDTKKLEFSGLNFEENLKSENKILETTNFKENQSLNSNRASELRHFIGILLNRSPNSKIDDSNNKLTNESLSNSKNLNKFTSNSTSSFFNNLNSVSKMRKAIDETCEDCDLTEDDEDKIFQDDKKNHGLNEKEKSRYYQDLSDTELGYTKERRSYDYYDDVKRTLNYEDTPPESPSDDEMDKFEFNNGTSTPTTDMQSQHLFNNFLIDKNKKIENNQKLKSNEKINKNITDNQESIHKTSNKIKKNNLKNFISQSQSMISLSSYSGNNLKSSDEQNNTKITSKSSKPAWK